MIKNEKAARNREDHLGHLQSIAFRYRNLGFEEMDRVVAEDTDSAAAKSRQFRTRDKLIARHQLAELIQWVACYFNPPLFSRLDNSKLVSVGLYHDPGINTDEGETSRDVILLSRFEHKAVAATV